MKQILLHLFGLSQADKARKKEEKHQEEIDAKNSRIEKRRKLVADFETASRNYEQECCELISKGYTHDAFKKRKAFLPFGKHNLPIFTKFSAAALFAKFSGEENISLEEIFLQLMLPKDLFSCEQKLSWFYKGYYIAFGLEPEYGYVGQETCIITNPPGNYVIRIASEKNALCRKIYLIFFINKQNSTAKKLYIRNPDTTETVLRRYETKISEEELIADCLKFKDHFK